MREPVGLLGFVCGYDGTACGPGLWMLPEEVGIGLQIFAVHRSIVVHIDQNVTLCFLYAAVSGMRQALFVFCEIAEPDVGKIRVETVAFGCRTVGAVVVYQHNLVLLVRECIVGQAFQYVVNVLVAVVGADDDGDEHNVWMYEWLSVPFVFESRCHRTCLLLHIPRLDISRKAVG